MHADQGINRGSKNKDDQPPKKNLLKRGLKRPTQNKKQMEAEVAIKEGRLIWQFVLVP